MIHADDKVMDQTALWTTILTSLTAVVLSLWKTLEEPMSQKRIRSLNELLTSLPKEHPSRRAVSAEIERRAAQLIVRRPNIMLILVSAAASIGFLFWGSYFARENMGEAAFLFGQSDSVFWIYVLNVLFSLGTSIYFAILVSSALRARASYDLLAKSIPESRDVDKVFPSYFVEDLKKSRKSNTKVPVETCKKCGAAIGSES